MKKYKAFRLFDSGGGKDNVSDYNKLLDDGWVPVREVPMGGTAPGWMANLCILSKDEGSVEEAMRLKGANLLSDEDIFVTALGRSRDEAQGMVARMKIQKLADLKLQLMAQNPELDNDVD